MKRLRIHRNPHCEKCAGYARMHRRLDWLGRIEDSTVSPWRRSLRMGEVVVEDLADGRLHAGAEGMRMLCRNIPAYWPLLPLFGIAAFRRRVDAEVAGQRAPRHSLDSTGHTR
jgi:hypothetical protein